MLGEGRIVRKLLLEVFQMLEGNEVVLTLLAKYPIVDALLVMLMRAVCQEQDVTRKVDTELIIDSLRDRFSVKVYNTAF